jgi:hypothetical protein
MKLTHEPRDGWFGILFHEQYRCKRLGSPPLQTIEGLRRLICQLHVIGAAMKRTQESDYEMGVSSWSSDPCDQFGQAIRSNLFQDRR